MGFWAILVDAANQNLTGFIDRFGNWDGTGERKITGFGISTLDVGSSQALWILVDFSL